MSSTSRRRARKPGTGCCRAASSMPWKGLLAKARSMRKVVEQVLAESQATAWTEAPAVGEGQEFRAEFNGSIGSALSLDEAVVHMNVLTAPA